MEKATLADFRPLPDGADQYPLEYIENNSVIKLRETAECIDIGICNASDVVLIESLRNFHRKKVAFYDIDRSELAAYLGDRLSNVSPKAGAAQAALDEKLLLDKLANDAPVINLVNSILIEAIRVGASDIHVECFSEQMVVRYRLDGYLHTVRQLDKENFPAISSRIKIMANLNIMERRRPQDGRITVHLGGDMVDMRVSVVPIANGESFVLRLFSKKKTPLTLDQLGLAEDDLAVLVRIAQKPNGLLLVTGPTGSGKTNTLYSSISRINTPETNIMTAEDPVEFNLHGINQVQIRENIGLNFAAALRSFLRQDPNIILVGEIRDFETAEIAVKAALTGHLVLSTLHTNDAPSTVNRLMNMGIETFLISSTVVAVANCTQLASVAGLFCGLLSTWSLMSSPGSL